MKLKDKLVLGSITFVIVAPLIASSLYFLRAVNSMALHTKVIQPQQDVECVVVTSTESIAVSCWKTDTCNQQT